MPALCRLVTAILLAVPASVPRADADATPRVGDRAPDFTLDDASGRTHRLKGPEGTHTLLLFGHRGLRAENRRWAQSFKDHFAKRTDVRVLMIADMRGIPFFVSRSFVQRQVAKEPRPVPLLLDWGQEVNKRYGIDRQRIEIIAVDPAGQIVLRERVEDCDEASFKAVLSKLPFSASEPAGTEQG